MDFFFFILVNAALFIRPPELFPDWFDPRFQLYQYLIVPCFLASIPAVLRQLTPTALQRNPITLCVLGLFFADILSNAVNLHLDDAFWHGLDFAKMLIYYLLLVGLVTTPQRLNRWLIWLAIFAGVVATLSVADYYKVIDLPHLEALKDSAGEDKYGKEVFIQRMRGTGLFADPNDFCQMVALAVPICLCQLLRKGAGAVRLFWQLALGLFGLALLLTQSRGGFLAVMAGVAAVIVFRYGWRRALLIGMFLLPVVLIVFAGRATEIDLKEGTGRERIQIWSDALVTFRAAPVFGMGVGQFNKEYSTLVVHNSFLHAYVEMGLLGGTFFFGAYFLAAWQLGRLVRPPHEIVDPELRAWHPYLMGLLVGFIVSLLSLSRCYIVSTYAPLGLAVAFVQMAPVRPEQEPVVADVRLGGRIFAAGIAMLIATYIFVRLFK